MSMTLRTSMRLVIVLASLLQASAQLLSCADVGCTGDEETFNKCTVENTRFQAIGISNFSSAISPNPLSWTVAYSAATNANDDNKRVYYLGSELDLQAKSDILGCALFFSGVESGQTFVSNDCASHSILGTCADAMGNSCPATLIEQAQDLIKKMTASGTSFRCSDLADQLKFAPPRACTTASSWTNITVKVITGPDSSDTVAIGNCNPTFNKTYQLHNVASFPQLSRQNFFNAVTPLMTVFVPKNNSSRSSSSTTSGLSTPEVHLNCIKPVLNASKNQLSPSVGKTVSISVRYSGLAAVIGVMAFMIFVA